MTATSSPSHYYSPDRATCDYHNGDLCRPYVSLSLRTTGVSPTLLLIFFFMPSRMPRTSPPFAGIRSLPINQAFSNCIWSDWLGTEAKRPPLGCSVPYCDLMSPEPAAFLQPLTPLTFVFASGVWNHKTAIPAASLLGNKHKGGCCVLFLPGYKMYWCLKPVNVEFWSGNIGAEEKMASWVWKSI